MTISMASFIILICSVLTGLIVQGIKQMYVLSKPNIVAAVVSVIVGALVSTGYFLYSNISFDTKGILYIISIIILSWLSAMLGYDKVVQTLSQLGK